jgi:hypothetical protein
MMMKVSGFGTAWAENLSNSMSLTRKRKGTERTDEAKKKLQSRLAKKM